MSSFAIKVKRYEVLHEKIKPYFHANKQNQVKDRVFADTMMDLKDLLY